ncbi:hypothetical protein ACET3Z_028138 [Daucus carota]
MLNRGQEVPRFDYNKFLHCYSNEEGVVMFEEVTKKLREVGSFDLADIFARYGEKMATRDRRRNRELRYGVAEEAATRAASDVSFMVQTEQHRGLQVTIAVGAPITPAPAILF